MKKDKTQIGRRFLGDMEVRFLEDGKTIDRAWSNFQKKHLRAYLKGHPFFTFGRDIKNLPIRHKVQQEFYAK